MAIGAYSRESSSQDFLIFTLDNPPENELNARADEILEQTEEITNRAAEEVESFISYLAIHFEEPELGIDY